MFDLLESKCFYTFLGFQIVVSWLMTSDLALNFLRVNPGVRVIVPLIKPFCSHQFLSVCLCLSSPRSLSDEVNNSCPSFRKLFVSSSPSSSSSSAAPVFSSKTLAAAVRAFLLHLCGGMKSDTHSVFTLLSLCSHTWAQEKNIMFPGKIKTNQKKMSPLS